jgi:competence protein ComEC
MAFPLLAVFSAFAFGLFIAVGSPSYWGVGLCVSLALLIVARRARLGVWIVVLVAFALLGGFTGAWQHLPSLPTTCGDPTARWRARVDGPVERPEPGIYKTVVTLEAEQCGNQWVTRRGRVQVFLQASGPVVRDDLLQLRLRLKPWSPMRNPTDADPEAWAEIQDLQGRAQVLSPAVLITPGTGILSRLDHWRHIAELRFEQAMAPKDAALAKALALGDRAAISADTRDAWADAGMSHIIAISGLHMTLLALGIYWFLYPLLALLPGAGERFCIRSVSALCTVPWVILFCLLTGASASAVRATVMSSVYLLSVFLGLGSSGVNALGIAGFGMLLLSPTTLYDPGFLLSFVAVAALLGLPQSERGVWHTVKTALLVSLVCSLATAPITSYYFGRVSLVAPLINLPAVPLSSFVLTPLLLIYGMAGSILKFLVPLMRWGLQACDAMAVWAARLPWSTVTVFKPTILECFLFFAALGVVFLGWHARRITRQHVMAFGGCFLLLFVSRSWRAYRPAQALEIEFAYVGQGDGAIVHLPDGGTMVVDAGGLYRASNWDPGRSVMAPLLRLRGISRIDTMVLTHPHPDHFGGLLYLAQHFSVGELWWSGEGDDLPVMQKLFAAVEARGGVTKIAAMLPAKFEREGVHFEILHPRTAENYYPELSTNNNSVALRLQYGDRSIFLAGDLEHEAEEMLQTHLRRTDVLKVGHHGSKTSSSEKFLNVLQPQWAVISCGEDNTFGFPHKIVVDRLNERHVNVLRTDKDGRISAKTDGKAWKINRFIN